MKLPCRIIICLFSVSICSAEIITRSFVLYENHSLDIEGNATRLIIKDNLPANKMNDSIVKIQCSDNTAIDLVYRALGYWDNLECECGGKYYGVTSKHPIYTIKTQSTAIFANPLDTADTNSLNENDNTINYKICKPWSAIRPERSTGMCGVCTLSVSHPPIFWYLSKTHKNHYFLFSYDTTSEIEDLTIQSKTTAKIICIIQTDGSLDFSKAFKSPAIDSSGKRNHTINKPYSAIRKVFTSEIASQKGVLYNLQGKRVDNSVARKAHENAFRLFIISNK